MRPLTGREKLILCVCLLTAYAFCLKQFGLDRYLKQKADIERQLLKSRQRYQKELRLIQKSDEQGTLAEHGLKSYFQSGSDEKVVSQILALIDGVAKKTELLVSDVKPDRIRKKDHLKTISVQLKFTTDLSKAIEFMYAVQKEPLGVQVASLRLLQSRARDSQQMQVEMVINKVFIDKDIDEQM